MNQIDLGEAERRIADREDVSEQEVQALLRGDSRERQTARLALIRTHLRKAIDDAGQLAALQSYSDQGTVNLIQQLAPLADDELPLIEALKRLGLRDAAAGKFEEAMTYLQTAVVNAGRVGQRQDRRSRSALNYLHDEEIDHALADLSRGIAGVSSVPHSRDPMLIAVLVAGLVEENSPTAITMTIAEALRSLGNNVRIVSAEYGPSDPATVARFREHGFEVALTEPGTYREKVDRLIAQFEQHPVHATVYIGTPSDHVTKVVSEIGVSKAQFFANICYEPYCGTFDAILETVSPEQEQITAWPGKARYIGSFVALGPTIDTALPIDRESIGIAKDAIVLGTYGRLVKCSSGYIAAVRKILEGEPRAALILAGPVVDRELAALNAGFTRSSAATRVHVLGPVANQVPGLLRATDVYLDSFPWPGGQSVLEAMWAGIPVVAMRRAAETSLDPLSIGPSSSTSEMFLPPHIAVAAAGDVDGYAQMALAYLRDPDLRGRDGATVRDHVTRTYSLDGFITRLHDIIREGVNAHFP